ncbi:hypothetical protein [Paenibacillus sambharensis]|uniref:hypothetical protein n=1 Tax=Paenibacillus sambharensis TaxID=1803190 RepID=UPI0011B57BFC|nr:hypothetical protein [Paenibacillus sambharensis]
MKRLMLALLTLLATFTIAGTALASEAEVASDKGNIKSNLELNSGVSAMYIPCDYYSSGQHKYVLAGSQQVKDSGGSHLVVTKNPDGSSSSKTCDITNYYNVPRYVCACGQGYDGSRTFSSTTHSIRH